MRHIPTVLWSLVLLAAGITAFAQSPLAQIGVQEQQARAWLLRTLGQGCPCGAYASDPEIQPNRSTAFAPARSAA